MKKFFVIGGIILIAGISLALAGMSMVDWNILNLDTAEYTRHEYVFDASLYRDDSLDGDKNHDTSSNQHNNSNADKHKQSKSLEACKQVGSNSDLLQSSPVSAQSYQESNLSDDSAVDYSVITEILFAMELGRVKVLRGDEVRIVYYESEEEETTISFADGRLNFVQTYHEPSHFLWIRGFYGLRKASLYTEIYLPNDLLIGLDISTRNGEILAQDAGEFSWLKLKTTNANIAVDKTRVAAQTDLSTTNGRISLKNSYLDALKLKSTNARLTLENITCASLDATSSNGSIICENVLATGEAKLSTTNAKIEIDDFSSPSATLKTTNGSIWLEEFVSGDTSLSTSNSSIGVEDSDFDTLKIKTSNGSISLEEIQCSYLEATSSNASIWAEDITATSLLKLATTNSSINFEKIDAAEILLTSTNAGISGTITGSKNDFSITTKTTNGHNNLGQHTSSNAPKTLFVQTTNGAIDINFEHHSK